MKLKSILKRIATCLAGTVSAAALTTTNAFAVDTATSIEEGISHGAYEIWNTFTIICGPIGAVAAGACALKLIFGSAREAEAAKSTLIRIVIGIGLCLLAPMVISTVTTWFNTTWAWSK